MQPPIDEQGGERNLNAALAKKAVLRPDSSLSADNISSVLPGKRLFPISPNVEIAPTHRYCSCICTAILLHICK